MEEKSAASLVPYPVESRAMVTLRHSFDIAQFVGTLSSIISFTSQPRWRQAWPPQPAWSPRRASRPQPASLPPRQGPGRGQPRWSWQPVLVPERRRCRRQGQPRWRRAWPPLPASLPQLPVPQERPRWWLEPLPLPVRRGSPPSLAPRRAWRRRQWSLVRLIKDKYQFTACWAEGLFQ